MYCSREDREGIKLQIEKTEKASIEIGRRAEIGDSRYHLILSRTVSESYHHPLC
jgi:hypothetical protein